MMNYSFLNVIEKFGDLTIEQKTYLTVIYDIQKQIVKFQGDTDAAIRVLKSAEDSCPDKHFGYCTTEEDRQNYATLRLAILQNFYIRFAAYIMRGGDEQ